MLVLGKCLEEREYLFYYRVESCFVYIPVGLDLCDEPEVFRNVTRIDIIGLDMYLADLRIKGRLVLN